MTQKPSLPVAFEASIKKLLGEDEAQQLLDALDEEAPTSIRISQAKIEYFILLKKGDLSCCVVPWCPWGYYLDKRPIPLSAPRVVPLALTHSSSI